MTTETEEKVLHIRQEHVEEAHASEHEHTTQVFVFGEEHAEGGKSGRKRIHNTGVLSVLAVRSAHNDETHTAQFSISQNLIILSELNCFLFI